ncbi:hypothetical protein SAMN05661044_03742 [Olivibacter domesticus]|uniref:Uncharacterized protein n=1 Tax=Olivibacter domesticus TaxID=407022 RepID=A0A1H7U601_OLID1|nr:hypothetical protein SAMN05661044_03742 [Olivibacter domesticus]
MGRTTGLSHFLLSNIEQSLSNIEQPTTCEFIGAMLKVVFIFGNAIERIFI